MEAVLTAIAAQKEAFAALPLFAYLRDESVEPERRLAFYPCMAHWVMSFADLNKYFLRSEPAADEHQRRVNAYSHEDDDHWGLYLEDFQKLGYDELHSTGAGWLRFLWGDATRANRMLSYRIAHLVMGATGVERLAIVESLEEAANVFFAPALRLAEQVEERTGVELRYLGHFHAGLEAGHSGAGDHESLAHIVLDDQTRRRALRLVEQVFGLFHDWADEVLRFATTQPAARPAAPAPLVAAAAAGNTGRLLRPAQVM
jgi:hypothetical protein